MLKKLIAVLGFWIAAQPAFGIDRFYLGGLLGQHDLHGNVGARYNDALGYGFEAGVTANPLMDIVFRLSHSSHAGGTDGVSLWMPTISADYAFFDANDFRLAAGGGPGIYLFNPGTNVTRFGLHAELFADVMVEDLRIGIGYRFHAVFDPGANEGNVSQILMRVGYTLVGNSWR